MSSLHPLTPVSHPSPLRDRVSPWLLGVALCAAPTAWFVQLNISVLLGMSRCSSLSEDAASPLVTGSLVAVGLAAFLIVLLALWAAARSWNLSRSEAGGGHRSALTSGHGRTRFLALAGLIANSMFLIAVGFSLIIPWLVVSCHAS
jgi:hypothetical protein